MIASRAGLRLTIPCCRCWKASGAVWPSKKTDGGVPKVSFGLDCSLGWLFLESRDTPFLLFLCISTFLCVCYTFFISLPILMFIVPMLHSNIDRSFAETWCGFLGFSPCHGQRMVVYPRAEHVLFVGSCWRRAVAWPWPWSGEAERNPM
jgi:hypothetical protein